MVTKVLWLTKGLGLGGAEQLLALTAAKLDADRFDVDVAYLLPWKDALVPKLVEHGVRAICLGARRTVDPRWVLRLRALVRTERYQVIHTHSPVPAAAARLLAGHGATLIHTEHNMWSRYRWPTYALNAATYRRNAAIIAVSDGVAASVKAPRWMPGQLPPVETLLHGVDLEQARRGPDARREARDLLGLAPDTPVIGTVANFTPKKDHGGMIDAIDRLRAMVPEVVALWIGTGPLEAELQAEVARRGLETHIRFLGMRDDVLRLLPALDVFVLGSRFEGLPISLLEAMAAGLPSVTTRVGGIPEAIDDGVQGVLVPAGDPPALADALSTLFHDHERREGMGAAAAERVRAEFSIDRAAERTAALYDELLS
jgi:glycosyltransferase involved in cell wall biosynthesis